MVEVEASGQPFTLKQHEADCFGFIQGLCRELNTTGPIPVPITSEAFSIILEYVQQKFVPKSEKWKEEYFTKYRMMLGKLLQCAQFLEMNDLCDEITKEIVKEVRGCQSIDQIHKKFNLNNKMSSEKRNSVMEKLSWTSLE